MKTHKKLKENVRNKRRKTHHGVDVYSVLNLCMETVSSQGCAKRRYIELHACMPRQNSRSASKYEHVNSTVVLHTKRKVILHSPAKLGPPCETRGIRTTVENKRKTNHTTPPPTFVRTPLKRDKQPAHKKQIDGSHRVNIHAVHSHIKTPNSTVATSKEGTQPLTLPEFIDYVPNNTRQRTCHQEQRDIKQRAIKNKMCNTTTTSPVQHPSPRRPDSQERRSLYHPKSTTCIIDIV